LLPAGLDNVGLAPWASQKLFCAGFFNLILAVYSACWPSPGRLGSKKRAYSRECGLTPGISILLEVLDYIRVTTCDGALVHPFIPRETILVSIF
jgi:hypothetical protein